MLNLSVVLRLRLVVVALLFVSVFSREEDYSNSWAVEVKGGHPAADALAIKHGFINKGQVTDYCICVACICTYVPDSGIYMYICVYVHVHARI